MRQFPAYGGAPGRSRQGFWRALLAVCAIALLLVGATALLSHGHAPGTGTHDGCSLCIATHAVIAIVFLLALFAQQTSTRFAAQPARLSRYRTAECPCWNRPPPAALAFS